MIVVGLTGGLGNQLFQYALGRRLSLETGAELKLDISAYEISSRQYRLNRFRIKEKYASKDEIVRLSGMGQSGLSGRIERALRARLHLHKPSMVKENGSTFQPSLLKSTGSIYLDGYWQSEKYFKGIEDTLRQEFTPREDPDSEDRSVMGAILNCEAISLHVRRGDYIANPTYFSVHGVCSLDYYKAAVDEMVEAVPSPHFFVFSDDPEWTSENLRFSHPVTYVQHNGEDKDYEDLRLMSCCKHHIIANSTFSWWGAWLASNENKIVIAPRKWYNDPNKDTSDLIPGSWRRL